MIFSSRYTPVFVHQGQEFNLTITKGAYYPQHIIPLRARINTSFQLAVYGNSENIFTVGNPYDMDGISGTNLYQNTVYIPKVNGYYLNIEY